MAQDWITQPVDAVDGAFYAKATGALTSNANWKTAEITLVPGALGVRVSAGVSTSSVAALAVYFDAAHNFLGYEYDMPAVSEYLTDYVLTVPANTKYIGISGRNNLSLGSDIVVDFLLELPAVILPTFPGPASAEPRFLDFGTNQDGGFAQDGPRIHRLGNRWALDVVMPVQWLEPHKGWGEGGRVFLSRLRRAIEAGGAIYPWPQLGLRVGTPGANPVLSDDQAANVDFVRVEGFRPGYVFREGQFFNVVHQGRHFLHSTSEEVMIAADGTATLPIHPRTRWTFDAGDKIRMDPVIEGRVQGDEFAWKLAATKQVPIEFSIVEFGTEGLY